MLSGMTLFHVLSDALMHDLFHVLLDDALKHDPIPRVIK